MPTPQTIIADAFNTRSTLSPSNTPEPLSEAIGDTLAKLDSGELRVCEKIAGEWVTHAWIKQAILLYFATHTNHIMPGIPQGYDKVPLKFTGYTDEMHQQTGVRVVPPACARYGSYIGNNTVLMPSYVNIGAYIDSGCMIDTWATVGSCAQIGKNVHISGGAGIGGVLEPLQAAPTIIEDNCFIGARSEIVEGVIVEENAVISMGVYIGKSTPIYNRHTDELITGRVPAGSVVIPGSLPAANGKYSRYAAIIMKQVDAQTRQKTAINDLLREEATV